MPSWKPGWHRHSKEPCVLAHSWLQPPLLFKHSLISLKKVLKTSLIISLIYLTSQLSSIKLIPDTADNHGTSYYQPNSTYSQFITHPHSASGQLTTCIHGNIHTLCYHCCWCMYVHSLHFCFCRDQSLNNIVTHSFNKTYIDIVKLQRFVQYWIFCNKIIEIQPHVQCLQNHFITLCGYLGILWLLFFNAVRLFQCIGDTSSHKDRQLC